MIKSWLQFLCLSLAVLACAPTDARAQSAVGTGPLTSTLNDTEPQTGALTWGPAKVSPGLIVREIGWDSNVFDEAENPQEDYLATVLPDLAVFSRVRYVQLSAYGGLELTAFKKFTAENSFGYATRGRVDFLLSRVRPFAAAGRNDSRTRANGEIDTRAKRITDEISGGLAYETGAHSTVYAAANRFRTDFENVDNRGINLETSLDRTGIDYSGGLKTDLTPLAALTVEYAYREDDFKFDDSRNSVSRSVTASLKVDAAASFSGVIAAGYENFQPANPEVRRFSGVTGSVAIAVPILEIGRVGLVGRRAIEYSFDTAEAYFVENLASLSYTHRLFGAVDAQVTAARSFFEYKYSDRIPAHTDTLDAANFGFGYNLRNRTRVSLNYEYSRRRSPAISERNYDRRRVYLSWTYAF